VVRITDAQDDADTGFTIYGWKRLECTPSLTHLDTESVVWLELCLDVYWLGHWGLQSKAAGTPDLTVVYGWNTPGPTLYLHSRNTMSHGVSWLEHCWVSHSVTWLVENLKHHKPPFLTVYHGLAIMGLLMIVYGWNWKVKHQVSQCRKAAPNTRSKIPGLEG
jgi:hypothetical protein